ncbi:hypothetical protein A3Q56_02367 [Intoshia linei]|uniref:Mitochondrial glutamate carrier 2 n=1 Tax=Intoshia linei TaxID=1819745 RepID=A0A177B6F5_9BILA|nr:hypothetical protein A3Q56_02367 [Intoshia linei]
MLNKSQNAHHPVLLKVLNGGIAGIVGVTCVFPLDLAKTRIQNQNAGSSAYKNVFDCLYKTFKTEKMVGLYRGYCVNAIFIAPEKAIKLVANDTFRNYFFKSRIKDYKIPCGVLSGALAGLCQIIVTTPMELLKIQLQDADRKINGQGSRNHKKLYARQIAIDLLKKRGFFGIYKGFRITALRDVLFSAIYFPFFAQMNLLKYNEKTKKSPFYWSFISGCTAGCVSALIANPLDVVKTRLQTLTKKKGEYSYTGIRDCFIKLYKYEKIPVFFKGGLARCIVIAPLFGIAQTFYYLQLADKILHVVSK